MKLAHITPPNLLEQVLAGRHSYHLTLVSQVLNNPTYCDWYREASLRGDTVILDNDAYESGGGSTTIERIKAAIELSLPTVIVLPDNLTGSGRENLAMARTGAEVLGEYGLPLMAVPHGHTEQDYMDCALQMSAIPGVGMLGIYKRLWKDLGVRRSVAIRVLGDLPVAFHLLGVDGTEDLLDPYLHWRCSGADTARFVQEGLRLRRVLPPEDGLYGGRQKDYFELPEFDLGSQQDRIKWTTVLENLKYWGRRCNGY